MAAWRQRRAPSCFLLILCVDVSASKSVSRVSCENATEATPRNLRCSIKSQALRLGWIAHQQALASEASMYKRDERGRARLVLLGDSITEAFRGTAVGEVVPRTTGQQVVLQQTLAKDFPSPLVLAISADETQHERHTGLRRRAPATYARQSARQCSIATEHAELRATEASQPHAQGCRSECDGQRIDCRHAQHSLSEARTDGRLRRHLHTAEHTAGCFQRGGEARFDARRPTSEPHWHKAMGSMPEVGVGAMATSDDAECPTHARWTRMMNHWPNAL
jgi:hypothetical protein